MIQRRILTAVLALGLFSSVVDGADDGADDGTINFSFDQVTVRSFVKLVGDLTGLRFVVSDDVDAKVTIVAPRIKRADVFPLFVAVLESAGCSVVEEGALYRVIKLGPRKSHSSRIIGPDEEVPVDAGLVTKVFHLNHVLASEMGKVVEARVSGGTQGAVAAVDETNHLIVTDTAGAIRSIEEMVKQIDQPGLARVTEVVQLKHVAAVDLAEQLTSAMSEGQSRSQQLKSRLPSTAGVKSDRSHGASVIPSPHANQLIIVGPPQPLAEMKRLITLMDVESAAGRGRLNAIFLKYISSEEAAKNLMALLARGGGEREGGSGTGTDISIQASPANNALLVDSTAADFEVVSRLVEQLDQMPQQVHISVLIAEQSASDRLDLGVQMASLGYPDEEGDLVLRGGSFFNDGTDGIMGALQAGLFPNGITLGVSSGTGTDSDGNVTAATAGFINIEAIKQNKDLTIQSETSLEAQNNKEASVRIVDDIPILKSTIQGGSGSSRDVIQNIERIEVGIKLKLTPHIIPDGLVQMELNPSIEAIIETGSRDQLTPTIARREVSTTVTVPDGRTIVIAGLTRDDKQKVTRRVPFLSAIPVIGFLFRQTSDSTEKTNMLIFVTPRIVDNIAMAERVKEEWREKTGLPIDDK